MSANIYTLQDVIKEYQGRRVLEVDRLEVARSEILALVGPSGAGKSTLLRLLNFLEPPSGGTLTFLGRPVKVGKEVPLEDRRKVTTVFQRPMLLNRSVTANVRFGLDLRGQRNASRLVEAALDEVGLSSLARQKPRFLSGGELQRVALARAMVLQPEVLLLDEPTANLDPYNISLIEGIITRLNQTQGTTLVLVTYNIFQARRVAQRVAFLMDGRVVEVSPTADFFNHPKDPRTAAFVRGEMIY